jgi:hypothetical protein
VEGRNIVEALDVVSAEEGRWEPHRYYREVEEESI